MLQAHRTILVTRRADIVKDLRVNDVLDELKSKFVLETENTEQILHEKTSREQAEKLLDILPNKGSTAFECFRKSLREKYPHLAQLLTENTSTSQLNEDERNKGETTEVFLLMNMWLITMICFFGNINQCVSVILISSA